jgi:hypothetical protein
MGIKIDTADNGGSIYDLMVMWEENLDAGVVCGLTAVKIRIFVFRRAARIRSEFVVVLMDMIICR